MVPPDVGGIAGAAAPAALDPRIRGKLRSLRGALRLRLFGRGLAGVVLALAAAAAASFIADYGIYRLTRRYLTAPQRLALEALALAGVAAVAWRRLVKPLRGRPGEADLALVVERAHPELGDRLVSAVLFSRPSGPGAGASPELVNRVIREANAMAATVRFSDALRIDRAARPLAAAATAAALLGGLAAARADLAGPWFRRAVLLADDAYPRETELRIVAPVSWRVARGAPFEIVVEASRYIPPELTFHLHFPSAGDAEETVGPVAPRSNRFVKRFESVSESFRFYVTGHDARTEEISVEVADPPMLADVKFTIEPPAYTRLGPQTVQRDQTALTLLPDSAVTLTATATKDLAVATIAINDAPAGDCRIAPPRGLSARFPVEVPRPYRPVLQLRIALTDVEGLSNPRGGAFTIQLLQDQPPVVQMAAAGVGAQVGRQALIPLDITTRDDYGVRTVQIEWAALSAPDKVQSVAVREWSPEIKEPEPIRFVLDLQRVAAAGEAGKAPRLDVGDSIRLQAVAFDARPAPEGPHRAVSNPITLRIVSDEDVLAALLDAQRAMREQLRQAVVLVTEVRDRSRAGAGLARDPAALDRARQAAAEACDVQQQANDLTSTVAVRLEEILDRMRNSRVGAETDRQRLSGRVIDPLKSLLATVLKPLASDLAAARELKDGAALSAALDRAATALDGAIPRLEAVLAELLQVENAQQVERGLRVFLKTSEEIRDLIRRVSPGAPKKD